MRNSTAVKRASKEAKMQRALASVKGNENLSIKRTADEHEVARSALRDRIAGRKTRKQARTTQQSLTEIEELTLVRWITRLTRTGYPASPTLAIQMAEELRRARDQLIVSSTLSYRPIGYSWLQRFKSRHEELDNIWTRQLASARFNGASYNVVRNWFDAITEMMILHQYPAHLIFNMDESGFAVGESQSSRALVNVREKNSWKVISGRQEWITGIECINAMGQALPPMIIFKAKYTQYRMDTAPYTCGLAILYEQ